MDAPEPEAPPSVAPASHTMLEAWRLALTRPNEETYLSLAEDPRAGFGRAAAWTAASALITAVIGLVGQSLYGGLGQAFSILEEAGSGRDLFAFSTAGLAALICMVPFLAALSVAGLAIQAGVLQFIAGAFGGQGTFGKMAFTLAAYTAPLSIVSGLLTLIPVVNLCLALPIGIYGIALNLLAIKVVNRFSWGRAAATLGVLIVVVAMVSLVLVLLVWRSVPADYLQGWPRG